MGSVVLAEQGTVQFSWVLGSPERRERVCRVQWTLVGIRVFGKFEVMLLEFLKNQFSVLVGIGISGGVVRLGLGRGYKC